VGLAVAPDWGVASRPKPGEHVCGDLHVVAPFDGGTLIAVVDALGHGDEAAAAAAVADIALREAPDDSVIGIVKRCHLALRKQRGVVMSLARFDAKPATLTWLGIGNVEGVVLQAPPGSTPVKFRLLNRGGVVGSSLPLLRAEVVDLASGGILTFATDGVDTVFADVMTPDARPAQEIASELLRKHAKPTDDALVLTARLGFGNSG
jgi:negative regulator of sigma-B (phosphoserine phosphatase)